MEMMGNQHMSSVRVARTATNKVASGRGAVGSCAGKADHGQCTAAISGASMSLLAQCRLTLRRPPSLRLARRHVDSGLPLHHHTSHRPETSSVSGASGVPANHVFTQRRPLASS
jgi:hypothetical protein